MDPHDLTRIIERAIQTERDGNRFYGRAAETVKDPKARKMFEQLARDELYHVEVICGLYEDLLPQGSKDRVQGYPIFTHKEDEAADPEEFGSEDAVLEKALSDERQALEFYRRTAESAGSGRAREVFLDLAEMEEGHIRLLQAERDFLRKTGFFFDHMEFTVEGERD